MCRFLPTVEEYLDELSESSFLHYALNSDNEIISEEAQRQARAIPTSVFFKNNGFQDGKQICKIRGLPKHIKLLNADTCLVSVHHSETYVADLYLGYSTKPTVLTKKSSVNLEVVRSDLIEHDILLTLDSQGTLSTWDISHEKKRLVKRASSTRLVETIGSLIPERNKTSIEDLNDNPSTKITCYHLSERGVLLMASSEGAIEMRNWDVHSRRFQKMMVPKISTRISNIKFIYDLGENHCLTLDRNARVYIVHFKDSFVEECNIEVCARRGELVNVHYKLCDNGIRMFFLVFEHICYSLQLWPSMHRFDMFDQQLDLLFETKNTVKCSQMWKNMFEQCFLILGTDRNLLIHDLTKSVDVLWCYIENPIVCLDICQIFDDDFQLIIAAGLANKKVLQIHAVTGDLKWAYDNNASRNFPPNVRIKSGINEFDVAYNGCDDSCAMFAIDSENSLHKFGETLEKFSNDVPGKMTVLAASAKNCYFGCDNGDVYNFKTGNKLQLKTESRIIFLKVVDNFLVASTESNSTIFYEIHDYFILSTEGEPIIDVLSVKSNVLALVTSKFICVS